MSEAMKVHYMSDRMDWETPRCLFEKYRSKYGLTLDVCAHAENAKCNDYFSPQQNGLIQSWANRACWMNPPYGRQIGLWIEKARNEARDNNALVCCLLPARTDTRWFHNFIWDLDRDAPRKGVRVSFLKGRIKFVGGGPAPFPSMVVVFFPQIPEAA